MLQPFCPARLRTAGASGPHAVLKRTASQPRRPAQPSRAIGKGDGSLDDFDAYQEAVELYKQANQLSQLQTRYELETAWHTDGPSQPGASAPPSESAVMALLQEHGLNTREATSLFNDLYRRPASPLGGSPLDAQPRSPLDAQPRSPVQERDTASAAPLPRPADTNTRSPIQSSAAPSATATREQPLGAFGDGPNSSQPLTPSGASSLQAMSSQDARNPLDVIPLERTGVPQRPGPAPGSRRAPQPLMPSGTAPDEYGDCGSIPGGFTPAPQGRDEAWDDWGAASGGAGLNLQGGGEGSLGGGGTVPNQGQASTPLPSPFGQTCGETVTAIPYNPSAGPQARPVAAASSNSAQGSNPPTADPGQSLGGCGDVPVWDDSLFDNIETDDAPLSDESVFDDAYWAKARAKAQAPAPASPAPRAAPPASPAPPKATPGQSLGGCGDVPVWDDSLFDQTPPPSAFSANPASMSASSGRSAANPGPNPAAQSDGIVSQASASGQAEIPPPATFPLQTPTTSSSQASSSVPREDAPLSLSQLAARLDGWQRVLPGINPARLAAVDADLLRADVAGGLRALITLVSELPGRDVMSMLDRVPRLLWADELQARLKRCVTTLIRLHPSSDEDIVKDMVAEYPELIWRMDYYTKARLIDELPIEIQNMMIVADQGIGYTYRYYRNRRTNYLAEMTSDEPFEQQT